MKRCAFLYPGQGSQKVGMGADFYQNSESVRSLYDRAGEACGLDLAALCFEENDRLNLTEYTQAALVVTCLAMTGVVMERGLRPAMTAGLSLGEYAAIAAAGGLDAEDAVRLVRKRGILMQNTVPAGKGAMCAVLAMDAEKIEQVIAPIPEVSIANYNCPGQIVITGAAKAVETAAGALKEAGAKRTIMLEVSGPFHSPMLKPAEAEMEAALAETVFHPLKVPYTANVNAQIMTEISKVPALLKQQISAPVRWMQSMETMLAAGIDTFVEIGPGKSLSGFLKKIDRSVTVYSISEWEDVDRVMGQIGREPGL